MMHERRAALHSRAMELAQDPVVAAYLLGRTLHRLDIVALADLVDAGDQFRELPVYSAVRRLVNERFGVHSRDEKPTRPPS